jgi:hypothetical protein
MARRIGDRVRSELKERTPPLCAALAFMLAMVLTIRLCLAHASFNSKRKFVPDEDLNIRQALSMTSRRIPLRDELL